MFPVNDIPECTIWLGNLSCLQRLTFKDWLSAGWSLKMVQPLLIQYSSCAPITELLSNGRLAPARSVSFVLLCFAFPFMSTI